MKEIDIFSSKEVETALDASPSKQVEALTEVSRAIVSDLYLEDILKLIMMVTAEVMHSKICSLMLLNEETGLLEIKATQAVSETYLSKPALKTGEGIAGMVALEKQPIQVFDVKSDSRYVNKGIAVKEELASLLSVPVCVKGKLIGVLNCYTTEPHEFSQDEINLLSAVANQAAAAIENANLLVRTRLIEEQLETRKLIDRAKDIIMRNTDLKGDEAYRAIQRRAMNVRKSMREVAEAIILADIDHEE
jgi:two-component system, response regulator PdtaR